VNGLLGRKFASVSRIAALLDHIDHCVRLGVVEYRTDAFGDLMKQPKPWHIRRVPLGSRGTLRHSCDTHFGARPTYPQSAVCPQLSIAAAHWGARHD
jgi:hypothetical protein